LNPEASESEWEKAKAREFLKIPPPDSSDIVRKFQRAYQKTCRILSDDFKKGFWPIYQVLAVIPVTPEGSPDALWRELLEMTKAELLQELQELAQKYTVRAPKKIEDAIFMKVLGTTLMGDPSLYIRLVNLKDRVEFGDLYHKALSLERRCDSLYNQAKARVRNRWRASKPLIGEDNPESLTFQTVAAVCGLQELEREPPKKSLH
jgi:hypothetical protein